MIDHGRRIELVKGPPMNVFGVGVDGKNSGPGMVLFQRDPENARWVTEVASYTWDDATGRRLAALWNAFCGVPTETLERWARP